jgi:hypothetical protein
VSAGELAGFAVPTSAGVMPWALDAPGGVAFALAVPAGAAEGAILGLAQSLVLADELPRLSRRQWAAATALAAALAWLLGLTISRLPDRLDDRPGLLGVAAALLGTGLLPSLGTAQWLVLRRHVRRASHWIGRTRSRGSSRSGSSCRP